MCPATPTINAPSCTGLAILLPFLLSRNKKWKKCKLRIFTAGSSRNIDQAKLRWVWLTVKVGGANHTHCRMTGLLRKFRIDFSEVIEVPGVNNRPTPERYVSLQQPTTLNTHNFSSDGPII